jgi:PAS domain S-box-containing protein
MKDRQEKRTKSGKQTRAAGRRPAGPHGSLPDSAPPPQVPCESAQRERDQAQAILQAAVESLEAKVRQRTAELLAANEALRESCDELQAIYEGMLDGLMIVDIESMEIILANPAMYQRLGYEEAEFLQTTIRQRHAAEDLPQYLHKFSEVAAGRLTRLENVPLLHKGGSIVYFDLSLQRIFYHERPCVVILHHDVTPARLARAALERQQQSLEQMLRASDHERQLIAYDIHDGLAQDLAAAVMQFEAFGYLKDSDTKEAANAYRAGLAMLRQSHAETRRLISGVRPPVLDESGVLAAISHLVNERRPGKDPKIEVRNKVTFKRLAAILENAIYRIVQEALTNACKHSQSPMVRVSLVQKGERLLIEVRDWGLGFDPEAVRENRFGLAGIRQRASLLGGSFHIKSKPGKGSVVVVELPVVPREEVERGLGS